MNSIENLTRINTVYGVAYLDEDGYYHIHSNNKFNGKLLHRVIYEDEIGEIPEGFVIHHLDENPLNNNLDNLIAVSRSEHNRLHHTGKKLSKEHKKKISKALKGRKMTPEQVQKNREGQLGKKLSEEHKINISIPNNTTGYFRVSKALNKNYKQGFYWVYSYYGGDNKLKKICSVDLNKLKEKIIQKGLPWIVIDEDKASKSMLVGL